MTELYFAEDGSLHYEPLASITDTQIADAVRRRGYFQGWTNNQLIARQAVKLIEEVCELALELDLPTDTTEAIIDMHRIARHTFDGKGLWWNCQKTNIGLGKVLSELTDVQVVVSTLTHLLEKQNGEYIDLHALAIQKAQGDIKRGVRTK